MITDDVGTVIEDPHAAVDKQGRADPATTYEDVIDRVERPVRGGGLQRIGRQKGLRRGPTGGTSLPDIAVADTEVVDDMATGPETDAVRCLICVEITGDDHMAGCLGDKAFELASDRDGLSSPFPFVIELVVREMVGHP